MTEILKEIFILQQNTHKSYLSGERAAHCHFSENMEGQNESLRVACDKDAQIDVSVQKCHFYIAIMLGIRSYKELSKLSISLKNSPPPQTTMSLPSG